MDELNHYLRLITMIKEIKDISLPSDQEFNNNITLCKDYILNKIKNNLLMKFIISELNLQSESQQEQGLPDESLTEQISNLTNLLGGEQEIDVNNFDPSVLDNFGMGLASMFKMKPEQPYQPQQLKNEINKIKLNNNNNNVTVDIRRK